MLWLQAPAWGRRLAAVALVGVAVFIELSPPPTVDHPFLTEDVATGEEVGDWNTELRQVSKGVLEPVTLPAIAAQPIAAEDPVLNSMIGGAADHVPEGWLVLEVELPASAVRGSVARLVLVDTGDVVEGVVVSAPIDTTLGSARGEVAVDQSAASAVAQSAARGEVVVLIETR